MPVRADVSSLWSRRGVTDCSTLLCYTVPFGSIIGATSGTPSVAIGLNRPTEDQFICNGLHCSDTYCYGARCVCVCSMTMRYSNDQYLHGAHSKPVSGPGEY